MSRHPYRWGVVAVLIVAVLIAGLLVAPWGGDEAVAKEPRATLAKIMIPAAAFIPSTDNWDYEIDGLRLTSNSGGTFVTPVLFPMPKVIIRKVTLVARDSNSPDPICLSMFRAQPLAGTATNTAGVCSTALAENPQRPGTTAISPRQVYTASQAPYLSVNIPASGVGLTLYGAQVVYSY